MPVNTPPIVAEQWRIRQSTAADHAGIIRLGQLHHGERELADPAYSDWMFRCNFVADPIVVLGEELATGAIIGYIWVLPYRAKCGDRQGIAYLGCNGLVHPDYRHTTIYLPILRMAQRATVDGLYSYGFTKPRAVAYYRRIGMKVVTRLPLLVRPLNIGRLARERVANPFMRLGVMAGWAVASQTVLRPRGRGASGRGLTLREESGFADGFDAFWARVAPKIALGTVRDQAFLSWRFQDSTFRHYQILTVRQGEEIAGYAVLRETEMSGIRLGLIVDLLVEPGERGDAAGSWLTREATRRFQQHGAALAGSFALPHTQEYQVLRRSGYVVCPERFSPQPFQLVVRTHRQDLPIEYLTTPTNWFITIADHDAV